MNLEAGRIIWTETADGWRFTVSELENGKYRAEALAAWEEFARFCKSEYDTKEFAQKRCYGIARARLEIIGLDLAEKMRAVK